MTKFADHLFDDLMREHGSTLSNARPPAPRRQIATRRALLAVGGGGVAVAAAAGVLVATVGTNPAGHSGQVAGGKTPAYAVTNNLNGTVTLAVYGKSGIAGANAKLHELGDSQVYVVPVGPGCPSISSLRAPAVSMDGKHSSTQFMGSASDARATRPAAAAVTIGTVTVPDQGIPAGDILVVVVEASTGGGVSALLEQLTSAPAPNCVSMPSSPGTTSSGLGRARVGPERSAAPGPGKS